MTEDYEEVFLPIIESLFNRIKECWDVHSKIICRSSLKHETLTIIWYMKEINYLLQNYQENSKTSIVSAFSSNDLLDMTERIKKMIVFLREEKKTCSEDDFCYELHDISPLVDKFDAVAFPLVTAKYNFEDPELTARNDASITQRLQKHLSYCSTLDKDFTCRELLDEQIVSLLGITKTIKNMEFEMRVKDIIISNNKGALNQLVDVYGLKPAEIDILREELNNSIRLNFANKASNYTIDINYEVDNYCKIHHLHMDQLTLKQKIDCCQYIYKNKYKELESAQIPKWVVDENTPNDDIYKYFAHYYICYSDEKEDLVDAFLLLRWSRNKLKSLIQEQKMEQEKELKINFSFCDPKDIKEFRTIMTENVIPLIHSTKEQYWYYVWHICRHSRILNLSITRKEFSQLMILMFEEEIRDIYGDKMIDAKKIESNMQSKSNDVPPELEKMSSDKWDAKYLVLIQEADSIARYFDNIIQG